MTKGNATWNNRKGRSQKVAVTRIPGSPNFNKTGPYANSHLFTELNSIVESFTPQQRSLAESTGFRCFARPIHLLQFDRQFTVWLIPKVCTLSRSFSTSAGWRITFFQEDVEKVFGIPSGGKNVWDASLDKSQPMREKITCMLGMEDGDGSPMCTTVKVLRELAGCNLTDEQEDVFKVAFVVFVVCMLVDGNNPGECKSVNFWPALTPTEHIHTLGRIARLAARLPA
jgi:hypothetical protein